jgi:D-alanyl-lipoteichoic acid acyltransferase DltB (MBOAT superfamily)
MLFNSFQFWLFFAVVFALYFRMNHRAQNLLLLAASYFFYGCWDWRFLGLIMLSTVLDWGLGLAMSAAQDERRRKRLLAVSIVANLGILGFFKYYGFFSHELDRLCASIGAPALLPTLSIVLPVGISFYTFQSMSYTIDVYRKDIPAVRSLLDFALYVSFFPQLVAGPIERASNFLPQVLSPRAITPEHFRRGLCLIMMGLFRKVVIADNMAPIVNVIFATPAADLTGPEIALGIVAFAFQIYGDFSGYSEMARGVANWLGFDLMVNFRMPYLAVSPSDFWRRWHISLSQWLRDYLYIPLGGNRHGTLFTYRNLFLTMLLGGFWHGANWTFLAWGAFHGALLCLFRALGVEEGSQRTERGVFSLQRLGRIALMFVLICFSWLLFRAETLSQVGEMCARMATNFSMTPLATMTAGLLLLYVAPLLLFEAWLEWRQDILSLLNVHWALRGAAYLYVIYMVMFFPPPAASEFIYFQF